VQVGTNVMRRATNGTACLWRRRWTVVKDS
jgi:hypothetical protein